MIYFGPIKETESKHLSRSLLGPFSTLEPYEWVWDTIWSLKIKETLPKYGENVTELPQVSVETTHISKLCQFCEPINPTYCCSYLDWVSCYLKLWRDLNNNVSHQGNVDLVWRLLIS